jgi:hypothetical protein
MNMFAIEKYESIKFMKFKRKEVWCAHVSKARDVMILSAFGLCLLGSPASHADNSVKLKMLVITTGDEIQDSGLAYIKPTLDEMGVPYDVLNAATQSLTAETLSPAGCLSVTAGCVGSYNGIIVTNSDLASNFTPSEWDILHAYETNFHVREAVLSGWPGTYWDPNAPFGIYLDYGLAFSSIPAAPYNAQWTIPAANSKEVFEYVNSNNPLPVTDFAFAAIPRADGTGPRDGTVPTVVPLLKTPSGEALVSVVQYISAGQTTPAREVLISTVSNASFLIHSQAMAYEFVNWTTQGVMVGARFHYMSAHLDDLFIPNELWDINTNGTTPALTYRLNGNDINNAVAKQASFRLAHPTAGNTFKLDFPFNGAGAVVDQNATTLTANLTEDLVAAVVANKTQFRFISHTFTHADMDKAPIPANPSCDYPTMTTLAAFRAEINRNRTVWGLLGLPEQAANNRVLVSGNHSGLKDRKCTDVPELHPEMLNVQSDDIPFVAGANPQFVTAAASRGVDYLASDTSQINQNIEQYISGVNDGSSTDRLMLPRYPTSVFFNTINPDQLVDEYNYIFHDRFVNAGQDPCTIPGAICATRNYQEILAAEADTALRHILTFKKWPHFFHQTNVAAYDEAGNTLQFDWLNAVYTAYEQLFKIPVKNHPYYWIGDKTKDALTAKSAIINATWNRTTNQVTLSANKTVPNLLVTGLQGGELYGGQFIRTIGVNTTPRTIAVNRALTQ